MAALPCDEQISARRAGSTLVSGRYQTFAIDFKQFDDHFFFFHQAITPFWQSFYMRKTTATTSEAGPANGCATHNPGEPGLRHSRHIVFYTPLIQPPPFTCKLKLLCDPEEKAKPRAARYFCHGRQQPIS